MHCVTSAPATPMPEMSRLWNFSVRVQSWPTKIESDPVLIRKIFENNRFEPVLSAGPALTSSEQWCYDVIVLNQPCYDLFDEDVSAKQLLYKHGRNLMGDTGDVSPHFFRWGDMICHVPPLFLFRFCIWISSKNKSDVWHVLCEVLFMLDATHSQVDVEVEFGITGFC